MKLSRNTKIFINYVLGPLLFLWLSYSLYQQIKNQKGLKEAWEQMQQISISQLLIYLSIVLFLMVLNWTIEALKWQRVLRNVQRISLTKAFKAILSGVSFSATTPNRVGEYAGRVLFLDEGNRLRSVSLTIVCSMSQLIITLLMGFLGFIFLGNKAVGFLQGYSVWKDILLFALPIGSLILLLLYFKISHLTRMLERFSWVAKYRYLIVEMEKTGNKVLLQLLLLSLVRYAVFCVQYFLLFHLFGVSIDFLAKLGNSICHLFGAGYYSYYSYCRVGSPRHYHLGVNEAVYRQFAGRYHCYGGYMVYQFDNTGYCRKYIDCRCKTF